MSTLYKTQSFRTRLNKSQRQAVETTDGKVLILAGAGSGKTTVLMHRIMHLIKDKKTPPESILGLTFTNKAAQEMQERMKKHLKKDADKVHLTTFHSFCFHVLKEHIHLLGYQKEFSIYDDRDIIRVIKDLTKVAQDTKELPTQDELLTQLKNAKANPSTNSSSFIKLLQESLKAYNALDFDDLLYKTKELFDNHPEVLQKYAKQYQYVMVDEYQDTNYIQYQIASKISEFHNNLCVVGDDDQSIYSFRGARVDFILEFPYDTLIKLEENYRSTPSILSAANAVIANNNKRFEKTLKTQNPDIAPVSIFHAPNEYEEAEAIAKRIIFLKKTYDLKFSDFAVLYRSNHQSKPIEKALLEFSYTESGQYNRGIPYTIVSGTDFFERSEVKDVMSYLRLIANPNDYEALMRVINFPRRGISSKTIQKLRSEAIANNSSVMQVMKDVTFGNTSLGLTPAAFHGICELTHILLDYTEHFETSLSSEVFGRFVKDLQLIDTYQKDHAEETVKYKQDNITMIGELMDRLKQDNSQATVHQFVSELLLQMRLKSSKEAQDQVELLTFHSAKGLEFKVCFIIGAEDHILPHSKSQETGNIEEERRLFYVAITRAKEHLTISMSKQRGSKTPVPSNPSRFLFEIPKNCMHVMHYARVDAHV